MDVVQSIAQNNPEQLLFNAYTIKDDNINSQHAVQTVIFRWAIERQDNLNRVKLVLELLKSIPMYLHAPFDPQENETNVAAILRNADFLALVDNILQAIWQPGVDFNQAQQNLINHYIENKERLRIQAIENKFNELLAVQQQKVNQLVQHQDYQNGAGQVFTQFQNEIQGQGINGVNTESALYAPWTDALARAFELPQAV